MIYPILVGSFLLLLHSIEPRHLTNQSHPRVPWANGFLLIFEYYIHHIIINIHDDDDDVILQGIPRQPTHSLYAHHNRGHTNRTSVAPTDVQEKPEGEY
jgi:hypothetical protein